MRRTGDETHWKRKRERPGSTVCLRRRSSLRLTRAEHARSSAKQSAQIICEELRRGAAAAGGRKKSTGADERADARLRVLGRSNGSSAAEAGPQGSRNNDIHSPKCSIENHFETTLLYIRCASSTICQELNVSL